MIKLMNEIFYMRTITVVIGSSFTTDSITRTDEYSEKQLKTKMKTKWQANEEYSN